MIERNLEEELEYCAEHLHPGMATKEDIDRFKWVCREALKRIQAASAQAEIIRCRECKHWDKTWTNNWDKDYHYCPMVDGVRKVDFYCADAERRIDA